MNSEEVKIGKYVEENFKKLLDYLGTRKGIENSVYEKFRKEEPEEYNTARCQVDSLLYSFYARGFNLKLETDEKLSYQLLLICSFTQTHYLINDLLMNGHYIDSLTLIRKQLEILTRLHEIDAKPLQKLERKTPNVINTLGQLGKKIYPKLSMVAHMATKDIGQLMNITKHGDLVGPSPFPAFNKETAQEAFNAHFCITLYFLGWLIKKQEDFFGKEFEDENKLLLSLFGFLKDHNMIQAPENTKV